MASTPADGSAAVDTAAGAGAGVAAAPGGAAPRYGVRAFGIPTGGAVAEVCDEVAGVRACVAPNHGAELASLQYRRADGAWAELLYRGNDYSDVPDGDWRGKAPLLFPAVGRTFTPAQLEAAAAGGGDAPSPCRYSWGGEERDIGLHGFAMGTTDEWELSGMHTDDDGGYITCTMHSSKLPAAVQATYPFTFSLAVTHTLSNGVLTSTTAVTAGDDVGADGLPFSIGNHITLAFPFSPEGDWDAGTLKGSATHSLDLTPHSLLSGATTPQPGFAADGLPLSDPAACNMVVGAFADDDCSLTLTQPGALSVKVTQLSTSKDTDLVPHKYFVLWGDKDHGFFCPEPWLGGPNSLNTRQGLVCLPAGDTFEWSYSVSITHL